MSDIIEQGRLANLAAPVPDDLDHDNLRDGVRAAQAADKLTMRTLAGQIGVGESTLSAWLGGTYAGRQDTIAAKVHTWLQMRPAQARAKAAAALASIGFVATPTADGIVAALEHAQYLPDIAVIAGGAGLGKTTAIAEYERTHSAVWVMTAEPAINSTFAVLERLSRVTGGAEFTSSGRSADIKRRLRDTQALIIVDEAQHLTTGAIEQLRAIHDQAGVGLALVGNQQVYSRIDGGGRKAEFAQLFSRVGMRLRREKPLMGDLNAILDAGRVGDAGARKLLLAIGSKPGALRGMVKVLRVARMMAAAADAELGADHVRMAWSRVSDAAPVEEAGA